MAEPGINDQHVAVGRLPWKRARTGLAFKLLRACPETGTWVTLFRQDAGTSVPRHRHHGVGEYFVMRGCIEVNGGAGKGGVTATAGEYGYEPSGALHGETFFPVETVYLFTHHGPIEYLNDDGNAPSMMDWRGIKALWDAAECIGGE
jgi:acetylacetone-cleaving enzyme